MGVFWFGLVAGFCVLGAWGWVEGWARGEPGGRLVFGVALVGLGVVLSVALLLGGRSVTAAALAALAVVGFPACLLVRLSQPLSEDQLWRGAEKQRRRAVEELLRPAPLEVAADPVYKGSMKAEGRWDRLPLALPHVPSFVGDLLKYKKHEWIVVGLVEAEGWVSLWMNKGEDRMSVASHLGREGVAERARRTGAYLVALFHNHPNPDPARLVLTAPSQQDERLAHEWAAFLNALGISVAAYVCERGRAHRYAAYAADNLFPVARFYTALREANDRSWWHNVRLRLRLRFL